MDASLCCSVTSTTHMTFSAGISNPVNIRILACCKIAGGKAILQVSHFILSQGEKRVSVTIPLWHSTEPSITEGIYQRLKMFLLKEVIN